MTEVKKLICIGIVYEDKQNGVTAGKCKTLANGISNFYRRNSRGKLVINTKYAVVKVPYKCQPKNVNRAEQFAMKKYPGFDFYAMVVTCINVSHAGNKVAHLQNFLTRDGQHEVGHLLGLEHAGAFSPDFKLDPYGDGLSVMGKFPSNYLTAPQYQFKKWLPKEEIVEYKGPNPMTYTLKRISNFGEEGISTVVVKKDGKDVYISAPQPTKFFDKRKGMYLAVHLQLRGGSQKIKAFSKEFYDNHFTGLHIKVVSKETNKITFTVDYKTKGINYVEDPNDIEPEDDEEVVSDVNDEDIDVAENAENDEEDDIKNNIEDVEEDVEEDKDDDIEDVPKPIIKKQKKKKN